jgi:purine-binding chemotaxis protein CheW
MAVSDAFSPALHDRWVVVTLETERVALALRDVERIVRAVQVTPLPDAPDIVLGAIDVAGLVLPVLNLRHRLGLPDRIIAPAQQFVIARAGSRRIVLVVDEVLGIIDRPREAVVPAAQVIGGLGAVHGMLRLEDGLALIHDLQAFLSLDEEATLTRALQEEPAHVQ